MITNLDNSLTELVKIQQMGYRNGFWKIMRLSPTQMVGTFANDSDHVLFLEKIEQAREYASKAGFVKELDLVETKAHAGYRVLSETLLGKALEKAKLGDINTMEAFLKKAGIYHDRSLHPDAGSGEKAGFQDDVTKVRSTPRPDKVAGFMLSRAEEHGKMGRYEEALDWIKRAKKYFEENASEIPPSFGMDLRDKEWFIHTWHLYNMMGRADAYLKNKDLEGAKLMLRAVKEHLEKEDSPEFRAWRQKNNMHIEDYREVVESQLKD